MKKDLNWFKEKLETLKEINRSMWEKSEPNSKKQSHFNGSLATIDEVFDFLNQLDEPEVLSQEWINKHAEHHEYIGYAGVPVDDLQNLLVPKESLGISQKLEKVQIPQFVAEWIEKANRYHSISWLLNYKNIKEWSHELTLWCFGSGNDDNLHKLARAWLDGYTVEEEQKYIIKLDDESYLQRYEIDNKNIVTPFRIVGHLKEVAIKFENKERAEKVAELVEGKVEELEE